jgi:hypothetical protein
MKSNVSALSLVLIITVAAGLTPSAHATPINLHFSNPTSVTINGFVDVISGTFTLDPSITGTGLTDVLAADIVVSGDPEFAGVYSGPCVPWVPPTSFPGCVSTQDFHTIDLISPHGILGLMFSKPYNSPPPLELQRALWDRSGNGPCSFWVYYCWDTGVVGEAVTVSSVPEPGTATPEPGTLLMFGSGIIGLAGVLRRKINL